VQFAWQPAGGAHDHIAWGRGPVHRAEHLGIAWQCSIRGCGCPGHRLVPFGSQTVRLVGPLGRRGPSGERAIERVETIPGIRDQWQRAVLCGVERCRIQLDEPS